jgi:hypothetical protein
MMKGMLVMSFAALLLAGGSVRADDGHAGGKNDAGEMSGMEMHKGMKMKTPGDVNGLWAQIHIHHGKLDATVKAKKLDEVHTHAFAVRDLVKKVAAKAPTAKKAAVKAGVKNISKLAEALDKSGDAGDQAATEANLAKFDAALRDLQGLFDATEKK